MFRKPDKAFLKTKAAHVRFAGTKCEVGGMTDHVATKHKVQAINDTEEFQMLLLRAMLSEEEVELMWQLYKKKKDLRLIADEMGISYSTAKQRHKRALKTLGSIL